jgi:hypothetical protein
MSDASFALPTTPDRDAALRQSPILMGAASAGGTVTLDACEVERLPPIWTQLVAATALEARRCGGTVVIRSPSEGFLAAFRDVGLDLDALGPTLE